MCGIAGVLNRSVDKPAGNETLCAMGNAIAHRGPDGQGYWSNKGVGLVHRRLSIIDLAGGNQPLGNENGSVQVVFNGEIYNYKALRKELESRGHQFVTSSDTEVLPHLYEEQGTAMFSALNGMFAIVVVDHRQQKLIVARDPVGIKQIYYIATPSGVVFASEMKSVLASGLFERPFLLHCTVRSLQR